MGMGLIGAAAGGINGLAGALGASSTKKAAGQAADAAQNTARANNALSRENMQFSAARLDPYASRGNDAGNAINALLGLGVPAQQQYGVQPTATGPSWGDISSMWTDGIKGNAAAAEAAMRNQQPAAPQAPAVAQPAPNALGAYQDAFNNYQNSTGYQFQMDQGMNALNSGWAAGGTLQSGDAMKAAQTYGQNTGKDFFKDYIGLLSNQQGVGLSGASAVAGVGQNYVNSVSANNNAAGSAQMNSALARGSANAGMWGNIAGGVNALASSYGGGF